LLDSLHHLLCTMIMQTRCTSNPTPCRIILRIEPSSDTHS
jgi:hypothetical protein